MGCPAMHGFGGGHGHWGGRYMQSWRGDDGGRVVMSHMGPMIFLGWLVFMMGVMVGAKRSMMMQRMGGMGMGHGMGGPCGPGKMGMGMGGKMMGHGAYHHHHGYGMGPCCEKHEGGEKDQPITEGSQQG